MIQRIQSIYLVLAAVICGILFFSPLAEFKAAEKVYTFYSYGAISYSDNSMLIESTPLLFLISVIILINSITIFLYKRRNIQIRLSRYNLLLMVGCVILAYSYLAQATNDIDAVINYKAALIFPIIGAFLNFLAIRAIKKDEKLVRSYERIR